MKRNPKFSWFVLIAALGMFLPAAGENECDNWQTDHTDWIFCDDFEDTGALVKQGRYFEYDDNSGDFVPKTGVGFNGSRGMQVRWQAGEVGAGSIKLSFGRNPNAYMNKQNIRPTQDFREIYYRMYLKMQSGWQGNPAKLSRATMFTSANDWRQAMIAHLWSDDSAHLLIDPASCVEGGVVQCTTYNDFNHLKWLGNKSGVTPLFATDHSGRWYCIEAHVKLNDPGQSNGVQEFWIDGQLEARREGLNFVGTFADYGINAVFFENYWNAGSPVLQERYFDNIVVSTKPIGCLQAGGVRPEQNQSMMMNAITTTIAVCTRSGKDFIIIEHARPGRYKIISATGRDLVRGEILPAGATMVDLSKIARGVFLLVLNDGRMPVVSRPFVSGK
jgi:hypothetical protein